MAQFLKPFAAKEHRAVAGYINNGPGAAYDSSKLSPNSNQLSALQTLYNSAQQMLINANTGNNVASNRCNQPPPPPMQQSAQVNKTPVYSKSNSANLMIKLPVNDQMLSTFPFSAGVPLNVPGIPPMSLVSTMDSNQRGYSGSPTSMGSGKDSSSFFTTNMAIAAAMNRFPFTMPFQQLMTSRPEMMAPSQVTSASVLSTPNITLPSFASFGSHQHHLSANIACVDNVNFNQIGNDRKLNLGKSVL